MRALGLCTNADTAVGQLKSDKLIRGELHAATESWLDGHNPH